MLIRLVLIVIFLSVLAVAPAGAQSASGGSGTSRPYRGLFGPTDRDEQRSRKFTLMLSMYGGLDDTSRFASGGALDGALQSGRSFQGAQASLSFLRRRPRMTTQIDLLSALRYFADLSQITTQRHTAAFRMSVAPSRRVTIDLAQSVSYSPTYQLAIGAPRVAAPGGEEITWESLPDLATAGVDYAVAREKQMAYGSFAGLKYTASRGREFSMDYTARHEDFFTNPDFTNTRVAGRYIHRVSPGIDLVLGYGHGSVNVAGAPSSRYHDIDLGVNYRRSFTLSPRTSLGFSSGSAVVSAGNRRQFEVTGGVQVRRRLSARWLSEVGYQRGLQPLAGLPNPFIAGTVSGAVSGYLNSRTSVRVMPSYSTGADAGDPSRTYTSWISQARIDVALNRHWAVYAEHFYYNFRFATTAGLPAVLAAGLNRQGLRWGLALWAPLTR